MKENKIDVLNLEWCSYSSRDREVATLVCNYLRYMGYSVAEASIFNSFSEIEKYKPKLFFITNTGGAKINFEAVKYAYKRGIPIVSLVSEGNFIEKEEKVTKEFIWGWNRDYILYEDRYIQWTERTRNLTLKYFPELKGKIKVSGAVGFDLYKIKEQTSQTEILKKYHKEKYKKIVGVGCFDFGIYFPSDVRFEVAQKNYSKESLDFFRKDKVDFNHVLTEVIKSNPDSLFLLKEHPGTSGYDASGILGMDKFENTLIIKNEETIFDCINASDFWLVYTSTTAIEAWLMGKQTCLLNPNGTDFVRDEVYKGSPNYPTVNALNKAIEVFYDSKELPGFKELEHHRQSILKNVIQWDDGFNHVRAGNEIIDILEKNRDVKIKKESFQDRLNRYRQLFYWYLTPYFQWTKMARFQNNNMVSWRKNGFKELRKLQNLRLKEQMAFYRKNKLTQKQLYQIKCI